MTLAICCLAFSQAISVSQPYLWDFECGFPKLFVKYGSIASNTLGSVGVVA
jgi:hypothetical protein